MAMKWKKKTTCKVCLNADFSKYKDRKCTRFRGRDLDWIYDCSICGVYKMVGVADFQFPVDDMQFAMYFWDSRNPLPSHLQWERGSDLPQSVIDEIAMMRHAVSHRFKVNTNHGRSNWIHGNSDLFKQFRDAKLPSDETVRDTIIRYIGGRMLMRPIHKKATPKPLHELPVDFHSTIGAFDRDHAMKHVEQLKEEGFITYGICWFGNKCNVSLTEMGWDRMTELSGMHYQ